MFCVWEERGRQQLPAEPHHHVCPGLLGSCLAGSLQPSLGYQNYRLVNAANRMGSKPLLGRAVSPGLQVARAWRQGPIFVNCVISGRGRAEAWEADISNNDCGWSYPVSVGLKHAFHGDFSEAEKGKQLTGASRMPLGPSILDMLGTIM